MSAAASWIGCLLVLLVLGCPDAKHEKERTYIITVNERKVTVEEFEAQMDAMQQDYPETAAAEGEGAPGMRRHVLNQLIERLILLERAEELGLRVSDEELERAVEEIRMDYPDDTFEEMLLEQAVSLRKWKSELRLRLLLEKVISIELEPLITLTPADISDYYIRHFAPRNKSGDGDPPEEIANDKLLLLAANNKKEEAYRSWIEDLQQRYRVDVNLEAWEKINRTRRAD